MVKKRTLFFIFLLITKLTLAQLPEPMVLKEVTVKAYLGERSYLRLPSSASIVDSTQFANQHGQSLVPVLNTVPGVRMEERSPGSYRLSIRGSLLRSPFGIRNIKVYMDEFPLTDAGGNTYLNLLELNSIHKIEILKGPDGSLFGANSGGVVRLSMDDVPNDSGYSMAGVEAGSYRQLHNYFYLPGITKKNALIVRGGAQSSDGYRANSKLRRSYFQVSDRWNYSAKAQLQFFFFYSELDYKTPGGLTLKQWQDNPKAARPQAGKNLGAEEQQAGVRNKTYYGGIKNEIKINNYLKHVVAIFGTHTAFKNPFITNYEVRDENTYGIRTWMEASNNKQGKINLTFDLGGEAQQTQSQITNYGNRSGEKDTVQADDRLDATQGFLFARASVDFYNRVIVEASASVNNFSYLFKESQPIVTGKTNRSFKPQPMPRFAASYLIGQFCAFRLSVSRGYSPPTLAEIRASDNTLNTSLQPENGWNYEAGFRVHDKHDRISWDVTAFYYCLQNAIVRRTNDAGQEYFVNAGGTKQPGIESQLLLKLIDTQKGFIKSLQLTNSYAYNHFTFSNYFNASNDYSGNPVTGVPDQIVVTGLMIGLPLNFFIYGQHSYTGSLALNDANSVKASSYRLIQIKLGWNYLKRTNFKFKLTAGVDNLLDEKYSLGNDLNAFSSRYYNPAPSRNYYLSAQFSWR